MSPLPILWITTQKNEKVLLYTGYIFIYYDALNYFLEVRGWGKKTRRSRGKKVNLFLKENRKVWIYFGSSRRRIINTVFSLSENNKALKALWMFLSLEELSDYLALWSICRKVTKLSQKEGMSPNDFSMH